MRRRRRYRRDGGGASHWARAALSSAGQYRAGGAGGAPLRRRLGTPEVAPESPSWRRSRLSPAGWSVEAANVPGISTGTLSIHINAKHT